MPARARRVAGVFFARDLEVLIMPSPTFNGIPANRRFFGVQLSAEMAARLKEVSAERGTTASDVVRQAIAAALDIPQQDDKKVS